MSLRIATYNIRGGLGMDDVRSLPRIAEVLHTLEADIVCLQEVHQNLPWSGLANQPRRLKHLLGSEVVFQRNLSLWFGGFGNAIVTKAPVLHVKRHALPGGREPRGCLEVRLQTNLGELKVLSTHLGLSDGERRRQVMRLAEIVNADRTPVVLCGDFNEGPDAGNLQFLLEQTGLRDAGVGGDFTYSSDAPRARIDFVLLSETLSEDGLWVAPSIASDHYPVISNIKLRS
ncbi:MAG: endonuclease/exonuclease/phosphatase family protein [Capsulimonas sp.]|uniref:endonuclease/exonuclease/phosphatase family protein n=1 Tax=Capsulimonas sp. TaxID=2494211 RepID=UPI00326690A6